MGGVLQGQHPAILLPQFGVLCGCGELGNAQPCQFALVGGGIGGFPGSSQQFGAEGVLQGRNFLVDLLQFRFIGIREVGAGVHEFAVVVLHQAERLRVEVERRALLVDGLNSVVELGVEVHRIPVRCQPGRFHLLHLLQRGVGVGGSDRPKHRYDPIQEAAAFFQRNQRVFQGRGFRIPCNRENFSELLVHACLDGGLIIAILNLVEKRRLESQRAGRIKRVPRSERSVCRRCECNRSGGCCQMLHEKPHRLPAVGTLPLLLDCSGSCRLT